MHRMKPADPAHVVILKINIYPQLKQSLLNYIRLKTWLNYFDNVNIPYILRIQ